MDIEKVYPEIAKAENLKRALNNEFDVIDSSLAVVENEDMDKLPFSFALVELKNKFSQVYIAAEERLYLPDFWKDGVCLAHGAINDIRSLAVSIDTWLTTDIKISELACRFNFIKLSTKALVFEDGNEVQYTWNSLLNDPGRSELHLFIQLAIKDEILGKLFPFTSLSRLCFSRCTGYPYSYDLPIVYPVWEKDNVFEVRLCDDSLIGTGSAKEALEMIKNNLPSDIGPAVKGPADDL